MSHILMAKMDKNLAENFENKFYVKLLFIWLLPIY